MHWTEKAVLNHITQSISHLLPRHCLFCLEKTANDIDLCPSCIDELSLNNNACQRCASPLELAAKYHVSLCGNCLSHQFYYDTVYSPFLYSEEMSYLIKKLKYKQKLHYAHILSRLFIEKINGLDNVPLPQLIIPIPMHAKRLQQRGYNQALELSRQLSSHYQLPLSYNALIRSRYTELQAGLSASHRQKNIRQAFSIEKTIQQDHVVLVDDVMTTGCTVNEAAKVLKHHGVKQVDVWVIARAGLNL